MRFANGKIEIRVGRIPWPFPKAVYAVTVWPFIFYDVKGGGIVYQWGGAKLYH
jgi:hypothetical protein